VSCQKKACSRCGVVRQPSFHDEDHRPVCQPCKRRDPSRLEPCAECGKAADIAVRRADGTGLCRRCRPKVLHECIECTRIRPAAKITSVGPVCAGCHVVPRRACGECGRIAKIMTRARDGQPDLCSRCARPVTTCHMCGKQRRCTMLKATGLPICDPCRPKRRANCAYCKRSDLRSAANWPAGPACPRCYSARRDAPGVCPACGEVRALIAFDPVALEWVCGPCVGYATAFSCIECGIDCASYSRGRCARCCLKPLLNTELAGPDGTIHPQLEPLRAALLAVHRPAEILHWFKSGRPGAAILTRLSRMHETITHAHLDAIPQDKALRHLRANLVHTGVLPERDEVFAQLELWIEASLGRWPAEHRSLLRNYAHWRLLRQARARYADSPMTDGAATGIKSRIRCAALLLEWIDSEQTTLADLTQLYVDRWLESIPNGDRISAKLFLGWARTQRLAPKLEIPDPKPSAHVQPLDEQDRWDHVHRCLTDEATPLDVRLAAILILLYGQQVSRIVALKHDQIGGAKPDGTIELRLRDHPVRLPPAVTSLLRRQMQHATTGSIIGQATGSQLEWLFPGSMPGCHHDPTAMARRIARHELPGIQAREAALLGLAGELPSPVMADLLGYDIQTTVKWAYRAKLDWADYIKERAVVLEAGDAR
jgi:hypothetical protein